MAAPIESSTRSTVTAAQGAGDSRVSDDRDMRGGVGALSGTVIRGEDEEDGEAEDSAGWTTVNLGDEAAADTLLLKLIEGTRDTAEEERRDVIVEGK